MKKKHHLQGRKTFFPLTEKIWLIMKLTFLFTIICVLQATAVISQNKVANINIKNAPLEQFFSEIEQKTFVKFLYRYENIEGKLISIDMENASVDKLLDAVLPTNGLRYSHMKNNLIVISLANQEKTVTGTVVDNQGVPLYGVNVIIKGTIKGTTTNSEGRFTITAPNEQTILQFSFIGFIMQEIPVGEQSSFNIVLKEDTKAIEEVVVTALGIERNKKTLTYATQQVSTEQLTTIKDVSLGNVLSGKIAGVSITTSTGASGVSGDPRIIIRGDRSIQNNNQPLIVVDGIPYSTDGGGLSSINPDDIQSMNVLKGPAASALYGSSANNGVIVITTKKGRLGETRIEVNSVSNFDLPYLYPELQNEYAQGAGGIYQSNAEIYSWGPRMTGQTVQNWTGEQTTLDPQPDNIKKPFEVGYNFTNSFSYSTGNEKSTSYFSYSNTTTKGILKDNKMVRHNINLHLTTNLIKNLDMDFKITYFKQHVKDQPETGINQFSPMYMLIRMPRNLRDSDLQNYSYYNEDGELKQNTWAPGSTTINNPYWAMFGYEAPSTTDKVNSYLTLKYRFTDYLYLQLRGGLNVTNTNEEKKTYWGTQYIYAGTGDYYTKFSRTQSLNSDVLLVFNKELNKDFRLGLNLGAEIKDSQARAQEATANGLTTENKFSMSYASNPESTDSESRIQKQSFYGMGQVSFREYLFLDFTTRNDWSSTLPSPFDYFYPSIGLTGIVSDMITLPDVVSFAKVRGSYAEVGNDAQFASIFQNYNSSAYGPIGMIYPKTTKVAEKLIPEKTKSWEIGADLRFFENRLGIDFTWYKSNTYNQLVRITTPPTSGYEKRWINCGNIQNSGVEFIINARPIDTPNFKWNASLNFARNKNKVIELTDSMDEYEIDSPNLAVGETWIIKGRPYGEIFTKGYVRDDKGKIIVDSQGRPTIMDDFDLYLGNFNYDWRSGLTNTLNYKNWQMTFLIDLNYGGVRQSATEALMLACGTSKESLQGRETGIIVDGVKEDGSVNDISISAEEYCRHIGGRITAGSGEAFNHEATNSRLRELSIGYKLPVRNSVIKNLTVSAVGRNLFYIYNGCDWFDPDVSYNVTKNGQGAENAFLPGTRTLGINIKLSL